MKATLQYNFIHLLVNLHKKRLHFLYINKEYFSYKSYRFVWLDVLLPYLLRREVFIPVEEMITALRNAMPCSLVQRCRGIGGSVV